MAGIMSNCPNCGREFERKANAQKYCGNAACDIVRQRRYHREYKRKNKDRIKGYNVRNYYAHKHDIIYKNTLYRQEHKQEHAAYMKTYMYERRLKMRFLKDYLRILPKELMEVQNGTTKKLS